MREIILQKLNEIEQKENVKILFCAESGSRAWGFESPDSDYDVRFIYIRPIEYYLKLEETRDVIEWQLDDVWDINGWDIQKALRLLYRSNPAVFEWNNSPIVYKNTKEWESIAKIIDKYFEPKKGLYHYLSMAKKNYKEYLTKDEVKYKKYFYTLRPLFACEWIIEHNTPPPILFETLLNECDEPEIVDIILRLLEQKKTQNEMALGPKIDKLNQYIEQKLDSIEAVINDMAGREDFGWGELNEVFLALLKNS